MPKRFFPLLLALAASSVVAQQPDEAGLSARRLYYLGAPSEKPSGAESQGPAQAKPAAKPKPAETAQAKAAKPVEKPVAKSSSKASSIQADVVPVSDKKPRLGLRYNILKVDPKGRTEPREVDPDTAFHEGDCVAIRFTPNRGGYLYVFNQGSTGQWQALLPSAEMPEESNVVQAFRSVTVPENYCFLFDANPGTERLVVIISDSKKDVEELNGLIRGKNKSGPPQPAGAEETPPAKAKQGEMLLAANLNARINSLAGAMQARDLKVQKVVQPMSREEPPHSVYVVAANYRDQDLFLHEIKLRHE
jgi:hypothetical protein